LGLFAPFLTENWIVQPIDKQHVATFSKNEKSDFKSVASAIPPRRHHAALLGAVGTSKEDSHGSVQHGFHGRVPWRSS
jgi:hypothetical protein